MRVEMTEQQARALLKSLTFARCAVYEMSTRLDLGKKQRGVYRAHVRRIDELWFAVQRVAGVTGV